MPTFTSNLNLAKPLINDPTDEDLWGDYLNENMDKIDNMLASLYPVGSLYFNANNSTNPATLLGFGTWVAFGAGRIPIGVGTGTDSRSESKTIAAGATGGEYNHLLTTTEMPAHGHGVNDPTHKHDSSVGVSDKGGSGNGYAYSDNLGGSTIKGYGNPGGGTGYSSTGISIQNAGGGAVHNNMQPYIGVYIWQRTA